MLACITEREKDELGALKCDATVLLQASGMTRHHHRVQADMQVKGHRRDVS